MKGCADNCGHFSDFLARNFNAQLSRGIVLGGRVSKIQKHTWNYTKTRTVHIHTAIFVYEEFKDKDDKVTY